MICPLNGKFAIHNSKFHHNNYLLFVFRYYDKLAEVQARGSQTTHTVLRDILREVQTSMVPKTILKEWATRNFRSATDYWQFRKMVRIYFSFFFRLIK